MSGHTILQEGSLLTDINVIAPLVVGVLPLLIRLSLHRLLGSPTLQLILG
jgi:hypothetical protein